MNGSFYGGEIKQGQLRPCLTLPRHAPPNLVRAREVIISVFAKYFPCLALTDPDSPRLTVPVPNTARPTTAGLAWSFYSQTNLRQSGGSSPCRTNLAVNAWCLRSARVAWQMIHNVLKLEAVFEPPLLTGIMWSMWHSRSNSVLWQRTQAWLSRCQITRRVSRQISLGCRRVIFLAMPGPAPLRRAIPDRTRTYLDRPYHTLLFLLDVKRQQAKTTIANTAAITQADKAPGIQHDGFHFAARHDGLIPHDSEGGLPTRRSGNAVTHIARLGSRIFHPANIEVYRQRRIGGQWFFWDKTIYQNKVIRDLQGCRNERLQRAAFTGSVPSAVSQTRENVSRFDVELATGQHQNSFAPFFRIVSRYARSFLLFEGQRIRPESVPQQRARTFDGNIGGQNIGHSFISMPSFQIDGLYQECYLSAIGNRELRNIDGGLTKAA